MNILIVEDEPIIYARLERQIGEILAPRPHRIKGFDNLDDARDFLAENSIDLLFLDLNLYGENGFELLKTVVADSFHTIIVSAHVELVIQAFEYGVLDFVAKPFSRERLEQAIDRMLNLATRSDCATRFLSVKKAGAIELIAVDEIDYVQASGHYSELFCDTKQLLHDKSIERIAALLPANFERIHRSYIVNMNKVIKLLIEPGSRYSLLLHNNKTLPLSRSRYGQLKDKLRHE